MFWFDASLRLIRSSNFDGSGMQDIVTEQSSVREIAVDGAGHIYWATNPSFGLNQIKRANVDGSDVLTIVETSSASIVGLAILSLPSDFNGDDTVDAADYVVWRKTDGTQPGYDTWRANFGRTLVSSSLVDTRDSLANVPEPAACGLLLLGMLGAWPVVARRWSSGGRI